MRREALWLGRALRIAGPCIARAVGAMMVDEAPRRPLLMFGGTSAHAVGREPEAQVEIPLRQRDTNIQPGPRAICAPAVEAGHAT